MAVGCGIANVKQLTTMQQKKDTHVFKIPLASKKQKNQSEDVKEPLQLPLNHRDINTSTAYVEDTNVMVNLPASP
jgi:hypothetical protein